jgi:hypothetical protein
MRIKTSMNSNEFDKNYEKFKLPSMTIPDQTMNIRTILERHSRGLPIDGIKVPVWDGEDNDLPDWRTLDLSERQELAEHYKEELQSIKNRQQKPLDVDKNNERVDAIESISGEPSTDL